MKMTNLLLVSLCLLLSGSLKCVASRILLDKDPSLAFLDEAASEGPLLESFSVAGKSELLLHISVNISAVQPVCEEATSIVRLATRLQPWSCSVGCLGVTAAVIALFRIHLYSIIMCFISVLRKAVL